MIERIGLAMAGASCGLFVAAHVGNSGIDAFSSVALVFALMVLGAVGFYLGIDVPPHRNNRLSAAQATALAASHIQPTDSIELLSAAGTFLAAAAALVSVYIIVFDAYPPAYGTILLAACWLLGVTIQIVAGTSARILKT